jgi:hypothetical protein
MVTWSRQCKLIVKSGFVIDGTNSVSDEGTVRVEPSAQARFAELPHRSYQPDYNVPCFFRLLQHKTTVRRVLSAQTHAQQEWAAGDDEIGEV